MAVSSHFPVINSKLLTLNLTNFTTLQSTMRLAYTYSRQNSPNVPGTLRSTSYDCLHQRTADYRDLLSRAIYVDCFV